MALDDTNAPVFSYSPGTVQITQAADLNVSQTVDLESVDIGEEQTYTVTVTNNGEDDSQGVNLTYVLPEGATFVSATVNPSEQTDNNLTFDLSDLAKGESTNIEITVNASNVVGDNVSNAVVDSNTYDPDFYNDSASLTTTVTNSQSLPELSVDDISVAEGNEENTEFIFTVSLNEASTETISVDYATEDYTAIVEEDYTATNGTLEFAPGETEKTITVEVIGDADFEPDEIFTVNLSNAVNSAIATPFGTGTIQNDDLSSALQVSDIQVSSSSLSIELNGDINLDLLNLYRGENNRNALSDLTLVGEKTGTVKGSLVWNQFTKTLTFIKTTGILKSDNYTLTIPSKEKGIVTIDGRIIDGNSDEIGGDDYTFQFTIEETSDRILSIPDLTIAPAETTNIPITLDNVEGVTKLEFDLNYDAELLDVTAVDLNDSLPSDWQLSENTIDRDNGIINVTIEGSDPLTGNSLDIVNLEAIVPDTANYGETQILDLANVISNDGTVEAIDDDGLHQVIKAGDATGDGTISGLDAYQMMRVSVGLDDGFDRFSTVDPVIIADINQDGVISGFDAYYAVNN